MKNDLFKGIYRIPSSRADWHNYNHGCYFITICTDKREHFFGEISNEKISMSKLGIYTESYIDYLNSKYDDFKIISHVIMPNHVHLIISVDAHNKSKKQDTYNNIEVNEMMRDISKQCGRLSYIISIFKRSVSNFAKKNKIYFAWQRKHCLLPVLQILRKFPSQLEFVCVWHPVLVFRIHGHVFVWL